MLIRSLVLTFTVTIVLLPNLETVSSSLTKGETNQFSRILNIDYRDQGE